jgi:hypothetical protein
MDNYLLVGPPVRMPSDLIEKWGGEFGCPVMDENRNVLGFAASMPKYEGEAIEAITNEGEITKIIG